MADYATYRPIAITSEPTIRDYPAETQRFAQNELLLFSEQSCWMDA
jgi:hypothetical protein